MSVGRILRDYREAGSVNGLLALWGFVDDTTFLTKAGHVGVVYRVRGVDYEGLSHRPAPGACAPVRGRAATPRRALPRLSVPPQAHGRSLRRRRLPAADRERGDPAPGGLPERPTRRALRPRRSIWSCSTKRRTSHGAAPSCGTSGRHRARRCGDGSRLSARCSSSKRSWTAPSGRCTTRRRRSRCSSASSARRGSRRRTPSASSGELVNYAPAVVDAARLTHDTHLDYFVADSAIDCHRDHLLVGDRVVKVLSMKEPPSQTFAYLLQDLYDDPRRVHRLPRVAAHPQRSDAARRPESPPALLQQARVDRELRLAGDPARGDAGRRLRERDGPTAR